jgi:hypothetical protein
MVLVIVLTRIITKHREKFIQIIKAAFRRFFPKMEHKIGSEKIENDIKNIFLAWDTLRTGNWKGPLLGTFLSLAFDSLAIFFLFIAVGISLGMLISGYGLPILFGKVAFIFPGGLGVIESTMTALFTSLGIPLAEATLVVLTYRLLSFWIPLITGFFVIPILDSQKISTE